MHVRARTPSTTIGKLVVMSIFVHLFRGQHNLVFSPHYPEARQRVIKLRAQLERDHTLAAPATSVRTSGHPGGGSDTSAGPTSSKGGTKGNHQRPKRPGVHETKKRHWNRQTRRDMTTETKTTEKMVTLLMESSRR